MNMQVSHETITIESLTQYGVRVGGKNYNFSKFLKNKEFQVGKTYEVDIYTSDNGAKYINELLKEVLADANIPQGGIKAYELINEKDFEKPVLVPQINRDKRILVQGILQAVLQSQGLLMDVSGDYIDKVKRTTLDLVRFVEDNV